MNLITGATGILGIQLMTDLLLKGEKVRGLKREKSDTSIVKKIISIRTGRNDLFDKIEWAEGNVLDVISLHEAMQGCKYVYHCAAVVSYHAAFRDSMYETNIEGTANVVNVAMENNIKKLCFVSSIAALGKLNNNAWLDEKTEWSDSDFNTHYGITKNLSEMEVWRGIQEGLQAVIVNPGFIIGPGEFDRSSASVFKKIDEGLGYYPPGGTGFVGVEDCSEKMIALMQSEIKNERFILVSENLSMQEIFQGIAKSLGKKIPQKVASGFLMHVVRVADWFKEMITGQRAMITRESIKNASVRFYYHNEKVIEATKSGFSPIADSIQKTAEVYQKLKIS